MNRILLTLILCFSTVLYAQKRIDATGGCGFDQYRSIKPDNIKTEEFESRMYVEQLLHRASDDETTLVVPVVVHIIHNNGQENIADAQVVQAIDHLNQAFSNSGFYVNPEGVDVNIQFCLVRQNPSGEFTTGINRIESTLTDLILETQDLQLKSLIQWDPLHYLNIWVVRGISSLAVGPGVAAYATFPTSAGDADDGIVNEYIYFGTNPDDSKVLVHEVGHYLGLYHTFEGGCANTNCLFQNDRVCDTPPDASVLPVNCSAVFNSCSTDADDTSPQNPFRPIALGGLGDVPDAFENYMDYGFQLCQNQFTQGQKDRMLAALMLQRNTLLQSIACFSPCTTPISATLNNIPDTVLSGEVMNLQANLQNATSSTWTFNGAQLANTANAQISLNQQGIYYMLFEAGNGDPACAVQIRDTITVVCPVTSTFSINTTQPGAQDSISVVYTGSGANEFSWVLSGTPQDSGPQWTTLINTPGQYFLSLIASNGFCTVVSDPVIIEIGNNCESFSLGDDFSICSGDTISLESDLSSFNAVSGVTWSGGSGTFIPSANVSNPLYVPSLADIAAGEVDFQIRIDANIASFSESESLLAYDHNGEDMVFYISAVDGAVINVQDNTGNDWTAMGFDPETNLLYGISNIVESPALWSINVQTNEVVYIAPYGQTRFWAGDYDNVNDIFYVVGMPWGSSVAQTLYRVNTSTGQLETVGNLNLPGGNNSGFYALGDGINGLAYDPSLNALFAVTFNGQLLRINVNDASYVVIGNTTAQLRGLAYDYTNNKLWGISNIATLTQIDKNSGLTLQTVNSQVSFAVVTSLTYAPGILNSQPIACYDSIRVIINPSPNPNLGQDTAACDGIALNLSPGDGFNSYLWSTGSTESQIQVNNPGTVWVEVLNQFGCENRDSIQILQDYGSAFDFSLGNDTIICAFSVQLLNGPQGDFEYRWWDFSTNAQSTIWQPGTFWLEVKDACGNVANDTIVISANSLLPLQLPNDTILCGPQLLSISLPDGFNSPVWMDGSTNAFWQGVPQQQIWVEVLDSVGCTTRDTLNISYYPISALPNLGQDTIVCAPDVLTLNPGNYTSYLWSDGSVNSVLEVNSAGNYWVSVSDSNGCIYSDTVSVVAYHPTAPLADLGDDVFVCDTLIPINLGVPPGALNVLWSTNQVSDSIVVNEYGTYWVTLTGLCDLIDSDTINISAAQSAPGIFPSDTVVCKPFQLDGGAAFVEWIWQDGSNQRYFTVNATGEYQLIGLTPEGCETRDTINVEFSQLAPGLKIPNVFSPNGDGPNDRFTYELEHIAEIDLVIFNRWGTLVYATQSMSDFWDGGGLPEGTYFYRMRYLGSCDQSWSENKGTVQIMR